VNVQFSLNSAEARRVLAQGFWAWPAVLTARRVVVCRSSTAATLMVERWPGFPWPSFAAGVTLQKGVCVNRLPAAEAVVERGAWRQQSLGDLTDLGPGDLVVKSGNLYDGERVGVLLGGPSGFGTMGRIFPELAATGEAKGCRAKVVAPMLSEKLVPPAALSASAFPGSSLGWGARLMVYRPDYVFDERDALRVLTGGEAAIVGRGASLDGYSVTTYHVSVADGGRARLFDVVDGVKGSQPLPFQARECSGDCTGCSWGGRTRWTA
jgi:hypothetical protein